MSALPQIGYSGNPQFIIECKDCKTRGHFNKAYHECKFYKAVSAADVGSSGKKRKQSATIKEEKKQAKRKKKQTTGDIKCISCGLKGHSTSRSLECPNHIASKEEVITSTLGEGSTVFTRKLPLTSAVKPAFREQFQEKVISCCSDIRRIVFSSQLFVNSYLIHYQENRRNANKGDKKDTDKNSNKGSKEANKEDSKKDSKEANKDRSIPDVFCQQFWYSVGQLITGKQVTHKTALSEDIKQYYTDFKAKFPTIENIKRTDVQRIVQLYCYQSVCHGHPHWPENLELAAVDKNRIELLCKQFEEFIPGEVTLVSLSAAPAKFVNALWNIQFTYEQEHIQHKPYDVRVLPLPQRFFLFPTPSLKWRFIAISLNALTPFMFPGKVAKGYTAQLEQFCKVFDFKKFGFKR
ncbi:hypothetical protein BDF20DRAFT_850760 [Mycotypha africana]|uniref:uncharacterized protein n=1 Tax=Mycotypha africana TaxID=64632 RepID=UPI0023015CAD|nr:uncharacterized protein BDF20DRAFT_850760 [Mycotypha africana]KAI8987530.1 hypothetical protein BDF20DRAFT_850760 [Mycotypha africana]